jgi:hypothetical protein
MNNITKKVISLEEDERASLYKGLFDSPEGKLVLEDLRVRCYFYGSSALPDPNGHINDPYAVYMNEGMRSVMLYIQTQLEHEPKGTNNA